MMKIDQAIIKQLEADRRRENTSSPHPRICSAIPLTAPLPSTCPTWWSNPRPPKRSAPSCKLANEHEIPVIARGMGSAWRPAPFPLAEAWC